MKIVCISDTHNRHAELQLPPGDVLVHAGDYSMQGRVAETEAFLSWFAAQPHRHKVFIAGNHDLIFEKRRKKARAMVPQGVMYLEDEGVTLDGIKFWGSPVTPTFYDWAFNHGPVTIGGYWDAIPDDTDVLITHGRNYNVVELGPRGTGKSHLYQQVSPYAHLVSGGKASVARMFVNNASGQRGLVTQYDVVCFDEVSGVSFDQKDGVNIMKGYMESGEFSRGRESIRADGGVVMVGNFDVDVSHQQRVGHLFGPMPPEMRDDTALMDRIHAYLPGWDVPKLAAAHFTNHFGLVSDFLAECWHQLRFEGRWTRVAGRVRLGGALSGRDTTAVQRTTSGLLKLISPDDQAQISDEDLEWAIRLALEVRRRVKEQQKRIGSAEFRNTHFSYQLGEEGVEQFVTTRELQSDDAIGSDPLPPGQVWALGAGALDEHAGLYRIDVKEGPGSGVRVLNNPVPRAFQESVRFAEQNLYAQSQGLVGERDPRQHEFSMQLRAFDSARSGSGLGLPALLALCSALLGKSLRGGLIAAGHLNLGGGIDPVHNAIDLAELAAEKRASALLLPISARRQLNDLSDEVAARLTLLYYTDARDALLKALVE